VVNGLPRSNCVTLEILHKKSYIGEEQTRTTMCRVAVRVTPRARPEPQANAPAEDAGLYEQLQSMTGVKEELDFNKIFVDDIDIDAG
jgi:hypothetical protein